MKPREAIRELLGAGAGEITVLPDGGVRGRRFAKNPQLKPPRFVPVEPSKLNPYDPVAQQQYGQLNPTQTAFLPMGEPS